MRDSGNGLFGMLLMLAPLVAVPVLAVTGIPQFAPVVASPTQDENWDNVEPRISTGPEETELGESARHSAEDLFAPLNGTRPELVNVSGDPRSRPAARNQFGDGYDAPRWSPPTAALDGWQVEAIPEAGQSPAAGQDPLAFAAAEPVVTDAPVFDAPPVESVPERNATPTDNPFAEIESAPAAALARDAAVGHSNASTIPGGDAPIWPARARPGLRERAPSAPPSTAAENLATVRGQSPERAEGTRTQPVTAPENSSGVGTIGQMTWQSAAGRLQELGIRKHYFTYVPDRQVFSFSCTMEDESRPQAPHRFEAEAPEPLLAVRDVLLQIDEWLARGQGQP